MKALGRGIDVIVAFTSVLVILACVLASTAVLAVTGRTAAIVFFPLAVVAFSTEAIFSRRSEVTMILWAVAHVAILVLFALFFVYLSFA